jgi:hypothetical protein
MDDPDVIRAALDDTGLDGARALDRMQDRTVKERLLRNTEQSVARRHLWFACFLCRRGDFLRQGSPARGRGGDLEPLSIQRQSGVAALGRVEDNDLSNALDPRAADKRGRSFVGPALLRTNNGRAGLVRSDCCVAGAARRRDAVEITGAVFKSADHTAHRLAEQHLD